MYHVKCQECEADYIRKTERILFYLIQEYKGESSDKIDLAIHEHQLAPHTRSTLTKLKSSKELIVT